MIVYPDPNHAPLQNVPTAMRERRLHELAQRLEDSGIILMGGTDTVVYLNLRELARKNGTIQHAQVALIAALGELRAVRVDVEASDVAYIIGNSIDAHAISRAIESGATPVCRALQSIEPDEIFSGIERALAHIYNDRVDESTDDGRWLGDQLRQGAAADLVSSGLIKGDATESYRQFLEPKPEVLPELPASFQAEVKPWKSPFDLDEY